MRVQRNKEIAKQIGIEDEKTGSASKYSPPYIGNNHTQHYSTTHNHTNIHIHRNRYNQTPTQPHIYTDKHTYTHIQPHRNKHTLTNT